MLRSVVTVLTAAGLSLAAAGAAAAAASPAGAGSAAGVLAPAGGPALPAASPTVIVTCPPALPIGGQVTGTTATSVTVSYYMLLTPPCGYDTPITVSLFASREDAAQWRAPVAEALSGPERNGSVTIGGLTPDTDYWFRFTGAGGQRDPYVIGGPAHTAALSACAATFAVDSRWGSGFVATVTVRNSGTQPLSGWQVSWRWPGDERVQGVWGGVATGSGADVTVRNAPYNGRLGVGASTTFGLLVSTTAAPAAIAPTCQPSVG
ncbi:cellulose binding domain-containing protein [Plantactinospora siamensis]|uniref:Cellulose binding domain-containing protein n=1 Tax=Plantactinospora siamensis TaxID=555372 RepID=A0ABV6P0V3_9ACTN